MISVISSSLLDGLRAEMVVVEVRPYQAPKSNAVTVTVTLNPITLRSCRIRPWQSPTLFTTLQRSCARITSTTSQETSVYHTTTYHLSRCPSTRSRPSASVSGPSQSMAMKQRSTKSLMSRDTRIGMLSMLRRRVWAMFVFTVWLSRSATISTDCADLPFSRT